MENKSTPSKYSRTRHLISFFNIGILVSLRGRRMYSSIGQWLQTATTSWRDYPATKIYPSHSSYSTVRHSRLPGQRDIWTSCGTKQGSRGKNSPKGAIEWLVAVAGRDGGISNDTPSSKPSLMLQIFIRIWRQSYREGGRILPRRQGV